MRLGGPYIVYGSYKWMCDICKEKFRQRMNLDNHLREKHGQKIIRKKE